MLWEKIALLKYTQEIIPDTKDWDINTEPTTTKVAGASFLTKPKPPSALETS